MAYSFLDAIKEQLLSRKAVVDLVGNRVWHLGEEQRLKSFPYILIAHESTNESYSADQPYLESTRVSIRCFARGQRNAETLAGVAEAAVDWRTLAVGMVVSAPSVPSSYRVTSEGKKADGLPRVRADVERVVGVWKGFTALVTIERPSYSVNAAGVRTPSWSVLASDLPCHLQAVRTAEEEERGLTGPVKRYLLHLSEPVEVTTEDRANVGGTYYEIRGYSRFVDPLRPPALEVELMP
jgi:hypothetical protein